MLTDVIFSENEADTQGGGIFNDASSPTLQGAVFELNTSGGTGGGIHGTNASDASLTDVLFSNNSAVVDGGGMGVLLSSPTLTNVLFDRNHATGISGQGGAMAIYVSTSPGTVLTNVTITGNTANKGGAFFNSNSMVTMNHATIAGMNAAVADGHAIYNSNTGLVVDNSIIWGNGPSGDETGVFTFGASERTLKDSLTQSPGGCASGFVCTNVSDADPLLGPLQDNGGFTHTMELLPGSAAIDTGGINTVCAPADQRGTPRPQGANCDIGAYEGLSDMFFKNSFETPQ
jgi:predicted outer membrane repeat protein